MTDQEVAIQVLESTCVFTKRIATEIIYSKSTRHYWHMPNDFFHRMFEFLEFPFSKASLKIQLLIIDSFMRYYGPNLLKFIQTGNLFNSYSSYLNKSVIISIFHWCAEHRPDIQIQHIPCNDVFPLFISWKRSIVSPLHKLLYQNTDPMYFTRQEESLWTLFETVHVSKRMIEDSGELCVIERCRNVVFSYLKFSNEDGTGISIELIPDKWISNLTSITSLMIRAVYQTYEIRQVAQQVQDKLKSILEKQNLYSKNIDLVVCTSLSLSIPIVGVCQIISSYLPRR